jgi:hypothetical protein
MNRVKNSRLAGELYLTNVNAFTAFFIGQFVENTNDEKEI